MNLDEDFFQVSKLSEDQKKKVFTRNGTLFLSTDLRSDAHQSQIIGGDADEDHTQIFGGFTVKLLGGYVYPPSPPCFGTTALSSSRLTTNTEVMLKKKKRKEFQTISDKEWNKMNILSVPWSNYTLQPLERRI